MIRTILLIEDDTSTLELERALLEDAGYRVLDGLGEAALATARRERPDLILLDLMTPILDGWSLREALLRHPDTRTIPVIVLTALSERNRNAGNLRATVMQKPFHIDDLTAAVRAAIGPPQT